MDSKSFKVKDMVFAKMKGFPWWPATISEIVKKDNKNKYKVIFIGDFT